MTEQHVNALPALKLLAYPFFGWLLSYTHISKEAGFILGVLLAIDVITAVIRVKITEPEALSSRTGIIGVLSKLLTFIIPFIVAIVGKGAGVDMTFMVDVSLKVLIIYEGLSIFTNIIQIRKKDKTLQENDIVSMLIKKIQGVFTAILDNLFANVPDKNNRKEEPKVETVLESLSEK